MVSVNFTSDSRAILVEDSQSHVGKAGMTLQASRFLLGVRMYIKEHIHVHVLSLVAVHC